MLVRNCVLIFWCITLHCYVQVETRRSRSKSSVRRDLTNTGTDDDSDESSNNKMCRYRWEWESIIYGDKCLPAKTNLRKHSKSNSIKRHRHRHKNKDYNDQPDIMTRHVNLYRKGETGNLFDIGDSGDYYLEKPIGYQMDAPSYYNLVSFECELVTACFYFSLLGSSWLTRPSRTYG